LGTQQKDSPKALLLARIVQNLISNCAQTQPVDEFEYLRIQAYSLDRLSKPEKPFPSD
jgi:hypothetical protein